MKLFACPACAQTLHFENTVCLNCGSSVGYHAEENRMLSVAPDGPLWRETPQGTSETRYRFCRNWEVSACNWLIPLPEDGTTAPDFCRACAHNRMIPDLTLPEHLAEWRKIETAKRRLIYSLIRLNLPLPLAGSDHPEPLIFDFLANDPNAKEKVMTGHASGVITIALEEADDVVRETLRSQLGEAYRTLLGHFRHEIGHYYWDILVRDGGELESFRATFGDERLDYAEALQRHYNEGPPPDWQAAHVSSYATMHPWEDWAETWAHYLHILDTLETAAALGIELKPKVDPDGELATRVDFSPYHEASAQTLLSVWMPLTVALNSLNRSMGQSDLYPFTLSEPVQRKFDYVHRLVTSRTR